MFLDDISGGKQVVPAVALCFTDAGQYAAERVPGLKVCRSGRDFTETGKFVRELLTGPHRAAAVLFFSAAGIAVRSIAPYVRDKMTDPAVIVINDTAKFVIPVLSGHMGRANVLAEHLAEILGAQAVITTASEYREEMEVPDLWAQREGYTIQDRMAVRQVTAAILAGGRPEIVRSGEDVSWRVRPAETFSEEEHRQEPIITAVMSPRRYVIGLGCRKGTDSEKLRCFAGQKLEEAGIDREQVFKICSIDLKSEETALLDLSNRWHRPLVVFSAEQLNRMSGTFTGSAFVASVTGTDNVCERSALAGCIPWKGTLLVRKSAGDGVTLAVAEREL